MFGTIESVKDDTLFVSGEYTIQYRYVLLPRNQPESGSLYFLFVGFAQCVKYPLFHLVCLSYAVHVKSDCFIGRLGEFGNLTTGLAIALLYCRLQGVIIQDLWPTPVGFFAEGHIPLNI